MPRVFASLLALLLIVQPLRAAEQAPLDPAVFAEAVNKLHQIGILSDPQYWIENVKPGKFIPSANLHPVLIAAANKFEPVDSVPAAIEVLYKNKILSNAEKWNNDIVNKPKAASGVITLLFMALSKNIN